jgi:hypothetical protein
LGLWLLEVVALVEVLDQSGLCRLPVEQFTGEPARGRRVDRQELGEPGEVVSLSAVLTTV